MSEFNHAQAEKIGILLTNLGTPNSPTKKDVRTYLKEFLSDKRVIKMSTLLWWPILNLIVLNTRPKKSAKAYTKVWTDAGSPLYSISKQQRDALQTWFRQTNPDVEVVLAMRYGSPSIKQGLGKLAELGARRILVLPLYPQYSATTTASTFDAVAKALAQCNWLPELRFVNHYHDHPAYIEALANSVRTHWSKSGRAEKLLMSFHGIPEEYFTNGDPYYCECQKTGRLLAQALDLKPDQWVLSFQSRLGPKQWLSPYTDKTLKQLGSVGTQSLDIICPGFSADCLETLEEMAMENRDIFLQAGGKEYRYIDCLNASPDHIEAIAQLALQHTQGWSNLPSEETLSARQELASKHQTTG